MTDIGEAYDRLNEAEPFPYVIDAFVDELGPLITTTVRYDDLRAILGWVDDLEHRMSHLLDELTGARLSKTGYDVQTMVHAVEENFDRWAKDGFADRLEAFADDPVNRLRGHSGISVTRVRDYAAQLRKETRS